MKLFLRWQEFFRHANILAHELSLENKCLILSNMLSFIQASMILRIRTETACLLLLFILKFTKSLCKCSNCIYSKDMLFFIRLTNFGRNEPDIRAIARKPRPITREIAQSRCFDSIHLLYIYIYIVEASVWWRSAQAAWKILYFGWDITVLLRALSEKFALSRAFLSLLYLSDSTLAELETCPVDRWCSENMCRKQFGLGQSNLTEQRGWRCTRRNSQLLTYLGKLYLNIDRWWRPEIVPMIMT